MLLDWILLIAIAGSVMVGLGIMLSQRAQLASIDVETIPEFQLRQQKYRLIEDRLNRKLAMHRKGLWAWISPIGVLVKQLFQSVIDWLVRLEHRYQTLAVKPHSEADRELNRQKVAATVEEGIALYKAGNLVEAEHQLLEAIRLNPQTAEAYKYIGAVYIQKEQFEDAIESLRYADKLLDTPDARIWHDLGVAFQGLHDSDHALEAFEKAVEINPSPKYLDALTTAAITSEDRFLARDAWKQLKQINPDNQKLAELEDMINEL